MFTKASVGLPLANFLFARRQKHASIHGRRLSLRVQKKKKEREKGIEGGGNMLWIAVFFSRARTESETRVTCQGHSGSNTLHPPQG